MNGCIGTLVWSLRKTGTQKNCREFFNYCAILPETNQSSLKNVQALYVGCVIDFLERCKSTFVPSPNHPHYRFGFFEGMNILGGIFGISSRSLKYSGPPQKARLVMHECMRVVGDRMMMRQDMVKLKTLISSTIIDHFGNDLGIDKLVDGSGDASSKFWHSKIYEICELKKKPLILPIWWEMKVI